ncbi:MAG TPA: cysteine desulfurase family protein [Sphingobacterium sp.]|nr:cysteine desulfurase family protein [Sphingobacterium sp.]
MKVYFDNAATTSIDQEVVKTMTDIMQKDFGNPSSVHSHGRHIKSVIEQSRRTVAKILNASPTEIFFTSGGTESDNMALICSVEDLGIRNIISSPIEHPAVLHTLDYLENSGRSEVHYLNIDKDGNVNLTQLDELLSQFPKTLVSLMHANNEIGNILDLQKVSEICRKHNALFHSDTVQSIGHHEFNLKELDIDFITGSAHKFHGPKGVGFIYINKKNKINPFIHGGGQERNMRGGTENVYGIAGLAKALEISAENREKNNKHIRTLKSHMIKELQKNIKDLKFNGISHKEETLYTVLNVSFPCINLADFLLLKMDMKGISASGGSACSSGSIVGSHVLSVVSAEKERPSVRFSFSKHNTLEEVDYVVSVLKEICSE